MIRSLLTAGLLATSLPIFAQSNLQTFVPSASEMKQLPEYCAAKYTDNPQLPAWQMWYARLGPNFNDIHHFCTGMNYLNRYYIAGNMKSGMLQAAMVNIDYMAKALRPDFPLRADVYLQRGIAYRLMGRVGNAISDFQQALSIDPQLTRGYLELIRLYRDNKQKSKALETAVAGLKKVPGTRSLQRYYLELGGKKPFPVADVEAAPSAADTPAAAAGAPAEAVPAPGEAATGAAPAATTPQAAPTGDAATPPPIGSPTNPYCRFCP